MSEPDKVPVEGVLNGSLAAVSVSAMAVGVVNVGASFTALTVTVTVLVAESTVPSLALKVKVTTPSALAAGVNVTLLPAIVPSVPVGGFPTMEYVSVLPSASDASKVICLALSSSVLSETSLATGAVLFKVMNVPTEL